MGDVEGTKSVLSLALGAIGSVKKVRTLYMVGQTRIHLDKVEGLGEFVEFEVCLGIIIGKLFFNEIYVFQVYHCHVKKSQIIMLVLYTYMD